MEILVLFLPAQQSGVEVVRSQRRPDSGVTEENNEISEGKIVSRETGGKPGEQKRKKIDASVCCETLVVWIQDLFCVTREAEVFF